MRKTIYIAAICLLVLAAGCGRPGGTPQTTSETSSITNGGIWMPSGEEAYHMPSGAIDPSTMNQEDEFAALQQGVRNMFQKKPAPGLYLVADYFAYFTVDSEPEVIKNLIDPADSTKKVVTLNSEILSLDKFSNIRFKSDFSGAVIFRSETGDG